MDMHSPKSWAELRLRSKQTRIWLVGIGNSLTAQVLFLRSFCPHYSKSNLKIPTLLLQKTRTAGGLDFAAAGPSAAFTPAPKLAVGRSR